MTRYRCRPESDYDHDNDNDNDNDNDKFCDGLLETDGVTSL
ncbi:MAG: hypothetical protein AADX96_09845 [Thiocapsa sp. C3-sup]